MAEETSAGSIGTARIDVTVNTGTMASGIEGAKRAVSGLGTEAEAQFNKASAAGKRYADSLLRQAEMLGKTRAEQIAYNAQTRIGGELGDKIAAKALANNSAMGASLASTGKSVKELQFAMRGVPAQLTDIFVGLSTGQRPLSVLLQQGGQLKDMFGGIGPAAKALGSSLLALVNPYTVAAAAATALFVAWKEGSDEATAYNKALISTGSYAGQTVGHLGDLAKSIGATTDATQHAAADALAQVTASGKFTGQQIELVGRAALAMSEMTGQATADTIKQFEDIGKTPVEAILKLNDAQHFLTLATYEQIKALEDQGHTQEAASLAMQTYSKSVQDRSKEVVENAGYMERAWHAVAGAAKGAWDSMLDAGRVQSIGDQAQALQDKIEQLKGGRFLPNGEFQQGQSENSAQVQALRKQISDLYLAAADESSKARAKADQAQLVQDKADADREAAQYMTNAQKRAQAYLAAENEFNARIARATKAGNTSLAEQERKQKAATLAGINTQFQDKGAQKQANFWAASIGNDPHADLTASIGKEIDAYKKEADQWARSTSAAVAYRATLQDMLDTRQRAIDLQVASIGMGQREVQQQSDLIAIDEDYNRKKAELQKRQQDATSALDKDGYQSQLDDLAKYHDQRVQMEKDGFAREAAARSDASLGAKAALADFTDSARDVAGQTHDLFTNAFDGMADALANFATTGKLNFKDLATSIISDMAKIEARILVSQALQSMFGGYGGTNGKGSLESDSNGFVTHVNAKGGVYDSPSLSAYSGQIVSKPTMFAFAKGAGLMGEAGPEAIMPLRRGSDGRLGVASSGGGSGDVQVEVNVTNNGQAVQARQTGVRQDGQKVIVDMVLDAVASDMASGGRTAKAAQQRFGLQRRGVPVSGG